MILLFYLFLSWQARVFVNDGFDDAIKHYDYKDTALDKAVDDLQKNVSIINNITFNYCDS